MPPTWGSQYRDPLEVKARQERIKAIRAEAPRACGTEEAQALTSDQRLHVSAATGNLDLDPDGMCWS